MRLATALCQLFIGDMGVASFIFAILFDSGRLVNDQRELVRPLSRRISQTSAMIAPLSPHQPCFSLVLAAHFSSTAKARMISTGITACRS